MPRFPTILVIGSQDMSTTLPASGLILSRIAISLSPSSKLSRCLGSGAPARLVARRQLGPVVPPLRLLVDCPVGDAAQAADQRSVSPGHRGRDAAAGRLVHERHELVREAGHRAADADAADVGASADP